MNRYTESEKNLLTSVLESLKLQYSDSNYLQNISNILGLDPLAPEGIIKQLACWLLQRYPRIMRNIPDYFQHESYRLLSSEAKNYLISVLKAYTAQVNYIKSTQYSQNTMHINPYFNYMPPQPYFGAPSSVYQIPAQAEQLYGLISKNSFIPSFYSPQFHLPLNNFLNQPRQPKQQHNLPSKKKSNLRLNNQILFQERHHNQASQIEVIENPSHSKNNNNYDNEQQKASINQGQGTNKKCICNAEATFPDTFVCPLCKSTYHFQCLNRKKENHRQNFLCHFCYMKNIDPLNSVKQTLKAIYIPNIQKSRITEKINFQQCDQYIKDKQGEFEIELKCMKLEDALSHHPSYTWPDECILTINKQKILQFLALKQHSSVKKRKDTSIFLTQQIYNKFFQKRKQIDLQMYFKQLSERAKEDKKINNNCAFILGIYLTEKKKVEEFYQEIMVKSAKVNYIQQNFSRLLHRANKEITTEKVKVNLYDPYTWELIETPVRGIKCSHSQCFDLRTYLKFMKVQRLRNWRCPVCCKECRQFVIDSQQVEAIEQYKKRQQGSQNKILPEALFERKGKIIFTACQNEEPNLSQ